MAASGGRAVGALVLQEGEVAVEGPDDVTVVPMQLTGPAIQTIDSYQNYGSTIAPQAYIQFQDLQELFGTPPDNSFTEVQNINLQLSNVNTSSYQGRVDHMQQTVSSDSPSPFSCLGVRADKMTVCGTNNSNENAGMAQEEGQACNKWKKFIKPSVGKKKPVRRAPQAIPDPVPERKRTAPINPAYTIRKTRVANSTLLRPLRDRVMHLLALRGYRKPELLVQQQKEGIQQRDSLSLETIWQQAGELNQKNLTDTLKDCIFKELERDWPGYNDLDRQSLELELDKIVDSSLNTTGTNQPEPSTDFSTDDISPSEKELLNYTFTDPLRKRKVRISHLTTRLQSSLKNHLNNASEKSAAGVPPPSSSRVNPTAPPLPSNHHPISNPSQPVNSRHNSHGSPAGSGTQRPCVASFSGNSSSLESQQGKQTSLKTSASVCSQMKYPKLRKNKTSTSYETSKYQFMEYKPRNQNSNLKIMEKQKTNSKKLGEDAKPSSSEVVNQVCTASGGTGSTPSLPDYVKCYATIVSSEQHRHYEKAFRAEYDDYQVLYTKMLTLSSTFANLELKRKQFPLGSKEYQDISEEISREYQKMRQLNPNFYAEKHRCQYLYSKLTHIKKLITDFDQRQGK
ncbi:RNA polymerase II elongation factor ELL2-like [Choloepus didactylus]|uniref:RNA polymerase II elongation factor ELL2-like n=1 Tax=Choloepus didactylus TaxID=27675 RepID=UPI00189E19DD|nr:RNA polymerase II elongation factor ELL2-like [Choloepus didactylus]